MEKTYSFHKTITIIWKVVYVVGGMRSFLSKIISYPQLLYYFRLFIACLHGYSNITTRLNLWYTIGGNTILTGVGSVHYISPLAKERKEEPNFLVKFLEISELNRTAGVVLESLTCTSCLINSQPQWQSWLPPWSDGLASTIWQVQVLLEWLVWIHSISF